MALSIVISVVDHLPSRGNLKVFDMGIGAVLEGKKGPS
jgi:hypothetical protein